MVRQTQEIASLTDMEFERFRQFARTTCGISLQPSKKALVSSRLERVLRRNGWDSYRQYIDILSTRPNGAEWTEFIDCLTTNHTGFFRESDHFSFLQKEVFAKLNGPVRIWSAACATGEEPYTIAMAAMEGGVRDFEILATDISRGALAEAEAGIYEPSRLAGLDLALRNRYLTRAAGSATALRVTDQVRRTVRFQPINLLRPFENVGQFEVIFCRNVMIYFERDTQDQLVSQLARQIRRGGYLFTGHSESLLQLPPGLEYVKPATYRKVS